jgi:hypothetical protein
MAKMLYIGFKLRSITSWLAEVILKLLTCPIVVLDFLPGELCFLNPGIRPVQLLLDDILAQDDIGIFPVEVFNLIADSGQGIGELLAIVYVVQNVSELLINSRLLHVSQDNELLGFVVVDGCFELDYLLEVGSGFL